jgi:hypothetical protein
MRGLPSKRQTCTKILVMPLIWPCQKIGGASLGSNQTYPMSSVPKSEFTPSSPHRRRPTSPHMMLHPMKLASVSSLPSISHGSTSSTSRMHTGSSPHHLPSVIAGRSSVRARPPVSGAPLAWACCPLLHGLAGGFLVRLAAAPCPCRVGALLSGYVPPLKI